MHGVPGAFAGRVCAPHLATRFTPCSSTRRPLASVMNGPPGARRYENRAAAGAAATAASAAPSTRTRASRVTRLLRVQLLDLVGVLLVDRLALELHRRRQLVATRLPVHRQDLEPLDLLDARQLLVGRVDALLHGVDHRLLARERLRRVVRQAVLLRESRGDVRV